MNSFWGKEGFQQDFDGSGMQGTEEKLENNLRADCGSSGWWRESVSFFEGWRDHLKEGNVFCWIFVGSKIGQVVHIGFLKVSNTY